MLLAHGGAGKTSLAEAMLFDSGATTRLGRVDDGTTVSDFDPEEIRRRISVNLTLLPFIWRDTKINLMDTPGYADFVGEVKAGLRPGDGAVLVVCAASGVEVGTERTWGYCQQQGLPRIIFINKMDRENADYFEAIKQIETKLKARVIPLTIPIGAQSSFQGVVDLLAMKAYQGEKETEIPSSLVGEVQALREKLVEAAAETDDALISKYLEGEELSLEEIRNGLKTAVISGKAVPVTAGSSLKNLGVHQLLEAIISLFPSPQERGVVRVKNLQTQGEETLEPSESSPLAALVFKTTADPYVGKLTYLRVYAGTLQSDSTVWNSARNRGERIGQLYQVRGKTQEPVAQIPAGDIGAVAKLAETFTGDTLCLKERPVALPGIEFPSALYSVAVYPRTKADLDKLGSVLGRLVEEDPTLQVRKEADTGETLLAGLGESHVEVAVERMKRKFGVDVLMELPKVPYKETISITTRAEYKHKKQTGGHGQYGHVFLELEPLPRGSGVQFNNRIVGGVVPRNYIPAVEKGVIEAVQEGVLASFPVVDVRVTLYDGSYHTVDSSDISFKIAGAYATRKGLAQGNPILVEPIMNVQVTVPDSFTGETIGDLNGKRARVLGMVPQDGNTVIETQAPLAEMLRYATALRSITQGRGTFIMSFSHYEEVPPHITQKVIEESKKREGKA